MGSDSGGGGAGAPSVTVDLSCDHATYPSALWTECEAENYAKILEAPIEEAANAVFLSLLAQQSITNIESLTQRDTADPSWVLAGNSSMDAILSSTLLDPVTLPATLAKTLAVVLKDPQQGLELALSLDTPLTPLCASYSLPCAGDPFRYPEAHGPDGSNFYDSEADVAPLVYYDDGCARITAQIWAPKGMQAGANLPAVVIENGSIEAPQTLYWWFAQLLVRNGYVVMTFDPRGQGRSDEQTPTGGQGGNINDQVFVTGLVDAIDFFRSSPGAPYPWNKTCAGSYPTTMSDYNPYYDRIDPSRLGIAGHSAGAVGVSVVQGLGAKGATPWFGKLDAANPVKVAIAWDSLQAGPGGLSEGYTPVPRVPSLTLLSEYVTLLPGSPLPVPYVAPYLSPPDAEGHKTAYNAFVAAGVPVMAITIAGATHFDFSQLPLFPATSWCPDTGSGACTGGWGIGLIEQYSLAWMDRWLKVAGEPGYADADTRLLNDDGSDGRVKMSWHFKSARNYPARSGAIEHCEDIRAGCTNS
jgi:hypothetical protein